MSTEPVRLERRAGQRFELNLPVSIEFEGRTIAAFSQNLCTRGIFIYSEADLQEGALVQVIFTMPSEITLAESMRVRCRGHVLRSITPISGQGKGFAVQLNSYEYLDSPAAESNLARVSSDESSRDPSRVAAR